MEDSDFNDDELAILDDVLQNLNTHYQHQQKFQQCLPAVEEPIPGNTSNTSVQTQFDLCAEFLDNLDEPQMEHIECLKSKFKHNSFRAKQWEIIRTIINDKRDVCAVMATGYGKSLCFQFPTVFTNGITLVVAPLIALMQDQVLSLQAANIPACLLGSAQRDKTILPRAVNGEFNLIYSSPEFLQGTSGKQMLKDLNHKLTLVAIDEAHCVSQWGHDFRPDFRRLDSIRSLVPNVPILAMTATATENVRHDIVSMLGLKNPKVISTHFERSNLEFFVYDKTNRWNDLRPFVTNVTGSVIIYVLRKTDAEEIAKLLKSHNVQCEHYHADVYRDKRMNILKRFKSDDLKVIVATIAFGMGIDKRDVRCVVHYGASKNLETYYQEVGRAGRDGRPSKVVTFFSVDDFRLHDFFLSQENKKNLPKFIKDYLHGLAAKMREFLYSPRCRRKIILEYFGDDPNLLAPRPNCCDNCTRGLNAWRLSDLYEDIDDDGFYDFHEVAPILLGTINMLRASAQEDIAEKRKILTIITGKFDRTLLKFHGHHLFGAGKMKPEYFWEALMEQLRLINFIEIIYCENKNTILKVTDAGMQWLQQPLPRTLRLKAIGQLYAFFQKKTQTPLNESQTYRTGSYAYPSRFVQNNNFVCDNEQLRTILIKVRDALAASKDISPSDLIRSSSVLEHMVRVKPSNFDEFRNAKFDGFTEEKLNKYGGTFINVVVKYTRGELEMFYVLSRYPTSSLQQHRVAPPLLINLIKQHKTMTEISSTLGLTKAQLIDHIHYLIKTGVPITQTDLQTICDESIIVFNRIKDCTNDELFSHDAKEVVIKRIANKYFNLTKFQISSALIAFALSYYQVRFHLDQLHKPYIDCEGNVLKNAEQLFAPERNSSSTFYFEPVQNRRPVNPDMRQRYGGILELMFGDMNNDYYYDFDYMNNSEEEEEEEEEDDDEEESDDENGEDNIITGSSEGAHEFDPTFHLTNESSGDERSEMYSNASDDDTDDDEEQETDDHSSGDIENGFYQNEIIYDDDDDDDDDEEVEVIAIDCSPITNAARNLENVQLNAKPGPSNNKRQSDRRLDSYDSDTDTDEDDPSFQLSPCKKAR